MTKKKQSTEAAVREIRRRTRRKFAPEEKVRIVLEGLRGEQSISGQLGHESVGVTEKHYAKWIGDDDYREPMPLESSEVPADLLAHLPEKVPTVVPTHKNESEGIPGG